MELVGRDQAVTPQDWAQTGVITALVLTILTVGLKGKWLFRWTHDEIVGQLREELQLSRTAEQEWKTIALTQAGVLRTTVEKTTEIVRTVLPENVT